MKKVIAGNVAHWLYVLHKRYGILRCGFLARLEDRLMGIAYPDV